MDIADKHPEDNLYPLDVERLKKGHYLTPDFCAGRVGCKVDAQEYPFKLMELKSHIERLCREKGLNLIIKYEHKGLRVLTDEEAVGYTHRGFKAGINRALGSHLKGMTVDVGELDPETRKTHENNLVNDGKVVSAIGHASKGFKLEAHKRNSPGLAPLTPVRRSPLPPAPSGDEGANSDGTSKG